MISPFQVVVPTCSNNINHISESKESIMGSGDRCPAKGKRGGRKGGYEKKTC
jgi:hypothetical protein